MGSSENIKKFSISKRIFSFRFAFKGILWFLSQQHNLLIHFLAAVVVTALGLYVHLERWEWVAVVVCTGAVIAAELFNSAIEILCDALIPERNKRAEIIKDVAAGAVLTVALAALLVAVIIFWPHFFS